MRYFFLISYYNIHLTPFIDELAQIEGNEVVVGLIDPAEKYRPGAGWDDTIDTSIYHRIYKDELTIDVPFLKRFDVVGTLGIYGDRALYTTVVKALRFTKARVSIFSEGLKPRGQINLLLKKGMIVPVNSSRVDLFAIGSESHRDYLSLGAGRWNMYRFGFTVRRNPNAPLTIEPRPEAPIRFITVGQLVDRKRIGDIIEAAAELRGGGKEFRLDVFGGGILQEKITASLAPKGLSRIVTLTGSVSHDYLFRVLPDYDCLILASEYDGWGAVVNEAMQAGVTVILSEGVRAKQLVKNGENGYVYPTGDIAALSQAMHKIMSNREQLDKMRTSGLRTIQDYYPQEMARRYHQIMQTNKVSLPAPIFASSLKKLS